MITHSIVQLDQLKVETMSLPPSEKSAMNRRIKKFDDQLLRLMKLITTGSRTSGQSSDPNAPQNSLVRLVTNVCSNSSSVSLSRRRIANKMPYPHSALLENSSSKPRQSQPIRSITYPFNERRSLLPRSVPRRSTQISAPVISS